MKKLLFLRKNPLETVWIAYLFVIGLIGLPYRPIGSLFTAEDALAEYIGMAVCRALAFFIMALTAYHLGLGRAFRPYGKWWRVILVCLPALVVSINNAPIIALIRGEAGVDAPAIEVVWFAMQCLFVGAFEEMAFRGVIFPLSVQKFGTGRKGRLLAVLFSSMLFGLMHLFNLLAGADVGSTVLQVGYSFLIGAMLAITMFSGGGVVLCAGIHALYNFCGLLIPELGYGIIWDLPTVLMTAGIAIAVAVVEILLLLRSDGEPMSCILKADTQMRLRDQKNKIIVVPCDDGRKKRG